MALIERQARLLTTVELGAAIRHFRFDIPEIESFDFIPGQWVSMTDQVDGKKVTRAYSIASLPEQNLFDICLNRVEDGVFSPHLFAMKPGDTIPVKGPVGSFTVRDKSREAIFVATGTGVVPFRPMLRQKGLLGSGTKVTMIFGARYEQGLMFHSEFASLAAEHPNFTYLPTVTRPSPAWPGRVGRIQQALWDEIGGRTDLDIYICGLKEMVDEVKEQLKLRGFDRKQIISEKYD